MTCNCSNNSNRFYHRVTGATAGANLELTTIFSDNINDKDPYFFFASNRTINSLPQVPLSVTVAVNGTQIPVWDKYGDQMLSSAIPTEARGYYSATPTPHVILVTTPETITIP